MKACPFEAEILLKSKKSELIRDRNTEPSLLIKFLKMLCYVGANKTNYYKQFENLQFTKNSMFF